MLPLTNLKLLNLQKNMLGGSLPFIDMPNLTLLDLSANQLVSVETLQTARLANLNTLYLSFNQLTKLPVLQSPRLEVYFFVGNYISSLAEFVRS